MKEPKPRNLIWIATSRRDMRELPARVRRSFGYAMFAVQCGETPPDAKPLKGFGSADVLELVADDRRGTYRAVYAIRFASAVYVPHVFQKKSKRGIATPRRDIELIRQRLKQAAAVDAASPKES